jgi:subtilisin family serine protease
MKIRSCSLCLIGSLTLVFGMAAPADADDTPRADVHPWVLEHTAPGESAEFFVVLREQADLAPAAELATKDEKGRFVRDALWETAQRSQEPLRAWLAERDIRHQSYYIVNALLVRGDRTLVDELSRRTDVLRIEGNPLIHNDMPTPSDTDQPAGPDAIEWGILKTNAPAVWAMGFTGQGVVVGGQDTGVDWDHPAIKNQYRGWNGSVADHDYNWHDSVHGSPFNPCGDDSVEPCDDHGHGTHTIGTAVGDDGGANQIGMAPGAQWIACRNMDSGNGTPATYLECFEFFLAPYPVGGTPAAGDPSKAPDVTNNSWSCPPAEGCSWDTFQSAVLAQRAAGIMTVVSATNDGPSCGSVTDPPAIYDAAYSVGSTTSSDALSGFSSRGPAVTNQDDPTLLKPDISAPGSNIRSSLPGGTYSAWSGTSMAGPHVAGAVALLWSAKPELKNDQTATEALINDSAVRLTHIVEGCGGDYVNGPNNSWGYGLIDVEEALAEDISLQPTDLAISEVLGNDNGVLEPSETFRAAPTWFNPGSFPTGDITGSLSATSGILPAKSTSGYGTIPSGGSSSCSDFNDCYSARISASRPTGHHDASITEVLSSGESKQ